MDLSSPELAEAAGLSLKASEKLWYNKIMKLTIHVLKDPPAGFKQVRYMERFLWIGKNTGIRVFMDRLDILSTYLPLFPPMKGEVLKKLSDKQKATILYDALLNYYIKNMKEANTEPIEMNLEELFQFPLNIEVPRKQGGEGKSHKRNGEKSSILKGQEIPSCAFCGRKGHTEIACLIKKKQWPLLKRAKDRSNQWKKDKAEKAQAFSADATASKQDDNSGDEDDDYKDTKAFMKSFMASWKSSKKDKKSQKNKRKRSDNDTSDSEQYYSMSSKIVALKPKRAKIGIPTT
jgi:hypothetical protein